MTRDFSRGFSSKCTISSSQIALNRAENDLFILFRYFSQPSLEASGEYYIVLPDGSVSLHEKDGSLVVIASPLTKSFTFILPQGQVITSFARAMELREFLALVLRHGDKLRLKLIKPLYSTKGD